MYNADPIIERERGNHVFETLFSGCGLISRDKRFPMQPERNAYVGPCVVVSWVGSSVLPILCGCTKEGVMPLQQVACASKTVIAAR